MASPQNNFMKVTKKKRLHEPEPSARIAPSFVLWPLVWCIGSTLFYFFHADIHALAPDVPLTTIRNVGAGAIFYSFGWLLARIFGLLAVRKRKATGRRRTPRLLQELVSVALFTIATMLTLGLLLGKSSGGVLASSGLIIARPAWTSCLGTTCRWRRPKCS